MENVEILEKAFEKIFTKEQNPIRTGFSDLDMFLSKADSNSLVVIGARPAMGKTSLMLAIFENLIKQNERCLFINLAVSNEQLLRRFLCQYSETELHRISIANAITEKDVNALSEAFEEIQKADFSVQDSLYRIEEIEEKIKTFKPKYVFIDYLQLIHTQPNRPKHDSIAEIMLRLKDIAKTNNVCIFISSQLSRAVESRYDKRPMLSDLRESGFIEDIADIVMLIYRDEYYNRLNDTEDTLFNKGKADIIVAKNKFGPVGVFTLCFQNSIPKFFEPIRSNSF